MHSGRDRIELPNVVRPCEFDLKSAPSAIVANAANLNVLDGLTFDVQRLDAVLTIADPIPTARGDQFAELKSSCKPRSHLLASRVKGTLRFLTCSCECQLSKAMNCAVKFGFRVCFRNPQDLSNFRQRQFLEIPK